MPGLIDCAVLLPARQEDWLSTWFARYAPAHERLRLHRYPLTYDTNAPAGLGTLCDASLLLHRYDVALLPVSYGNLAWLRTALAATRHLLLPVPLLAVVRDLQAPAIQDLLNLGVADFLCAEASLDELRVRVGQLIAARHVAASRRAESLETARPGAPETFQVAKRHAIAKFERYYLVSLLRRYAGNISMAARAAQKHRRAFWELLRKHQIDASLYRHDAATGPATEDGLPPEG